MSKNIRVVAFNDLHSDTKLTRWTDYRVCSWLSTSTCWVFDGGDAVGVVTGNINNVRCYTVIRIGEKVHVIEANLNDSMRAFGLDPTEFKFDEFVG